MEKLYTPVQIVSKSRFEIRVITSGRNIGIEKELVTVKSGFITHAVELIVDKHFKENSVESLHRVIAEQERLIQLTKTNPNEFDDAEYAVKRANKKIAYFAKAITNNGIFPIAS